MHTIYSFTLNIIIEYHILLFYLFFIVGIIKFILLTKRYSFNRDLAKFFFQFSFFLCFFIWFFWWFSFSIFKIKTIQVSGFFFFMAGNKLINFNMFLKNTKDYRYFKQRNFITPFMSNFTKTLSEEQILKLLKQYHNVGYLPYDTFLLTRLFGMLTFGTVTLSTTDSISTVTSPSNMYWLNVFCRFDVSHLFFIHDFTVLANRANNDSFFSAYSCYFFNFSVYHFTFINSASSIPSLSWLFTGATWIERELGEFFNIFFFGLRDGRRLLSDYTNSPSVDYNYRTTMYSGLVQDLYNIEMLHWLYVFSFLALSGFFSLLFLNRQLVIMLLLGEALLIIFFFLGLLLASFYNIYFLVGFSFFFLMVGGLELALNILLLSV